MILKYPILFISVIGLHLQSIPNAIAQSIPCEAGLELGKNVYNRMRMEIGDRRILEAQEARHTFWEIHKRTQNCPGLENLAQQLMDTDHGPKARVFTQAEIFQEMFRKAIINVPTYCFDGKRLTCSVEVDRGSGGDSQGDVPKRSADNPRVSWQRKPN